MIQLALLARRQGLRSVMSSARAKLAHLDVTERTALNEREPTIASPFGTALGRRRLVHDRYRGRQVCLLAQDPGLTAYDRLRSGLRLRRDRHLGWSAMLLRRGGRYNISNGTLPRPAPLAFGQYGFTGEYSVIPLTSGTLDLAPDNRLQHKSTVGQLGREPVATAQAKGLAQAGGQADPPIIVELHRGHGFVLSGILGRREGDRVT
jgi:hypothetical protein